MDRYKPQPDHSAGDDMLASSPLEAATEPRTGTDGEFQGELLNQAYLKRKSRPLSWIEALYETPWARAISPFGVSLLIAFLVYLGGLLLASWIGLTWAYTSSPAVFLAVLGVPLSMFCLYMVTTTLRRSFDDLKDITAAPDSYRSFIAYWIDRVSNPQSSLIALLGAVVLVLVGGMILAISSPTGMTGPYRPTMFASALTNNNRGLIVIGYFAAMIGMPVSVGLKLLITSASLIRFLGSGESLTDAL